MIGIIDYGMGNVGSLLNMVERLGSEAIKITGPEDLNKSDKLILPGVGSFDNGVSSLKDCRLWDELNKRVLIDKIPILCICLGMQLITNGSEEGKSEGLGWIDGECQKFSFIDKSIKIPHMGWNSVIFKKGSKLTTFIPEIPRFYFVHSYYVKCADKSDILSTTNYNLEFCASIEKNTIYATQFHPEKSHKYGMALIKGFMELC